MILRYLNSIKIWQKYGETQFEVGSNNLSKEFYLYDDDNDGSGVRGGQKFVIDIIMHLRVSCNIFKENWKRATKIDQCT
jgi:hypothetical protein